ncbi:MAG TPA: hypothetical protein PK156_22765 [Polyangium sp.]|nr:hypothetical protein [Polyangium sp.]
MDFQPLFRRFEENIKLGHYDESADLRQKRDRVITRLQENLSMKIDWFNQGSYAMRTGVKPLDGDYDIDIGIVLDIDKNQYDPVTVKGWIYKVVEKHTARVEWRRPCITVYYHQAGEAIYHVDLAILAKDRWGNMHLAIGKEHSAKEQREWQQDDRKGFIEVVGNRFSGEDGAQFRRVIRYLKRWRDVHFASEGRAAPTGLGLTVAAFHHFQPAKVNPYYYNHNADYDDLAATVALVQAIRGRFSSAWDSSTRQYTQRIKLNFPRAPQDDVFERMTNQQMQEFYQRLEKLALWLDEARRIGSTAPLRKAFGDDFPVQ